MSDSISLAYIRIWSYKNQLWVGFQTPRGDQYRVDPRGIYLTLPDRSLSLVNPRLVFPIVDRYPSLTQKEVMMPPGARVPLLQAYSDGGTMPAKRLTFEQVRTEVESYLSLLTHLDPIQLYVAIRVYESGLVGLPHVNRIAGSLRPGTSMGTELLQQRLCTWEDLLAVCMDVPRVGSVLHMPPPAEYELVGEIMVATGRLSRTQLQRALNQKRSGDKPLGEILLEMGACSKLEIENCLRTQERMKLTMQDRVGLMGELLVQHGIVSYDDLEQALRMQRIGRQPLHAVLVSMGICSHNQIEEFRFRYPQYVRPEGFDEKALAQYLVYHKMANERQLEEARRIQGLGRMLLGELLITMKKASPQAIEQVMGKQQAMRSEAKRPVQKLGDLLVETRAVDSSSVEEAARIQTISRQKMGTTLVSLAGCSQEDFEEALELQFNWRNAVAKLTSGDMLGQELLRVGEVSQQNLERALQIQSRAAGKPLGQILVETNSCSPESVIETLLRRDDRRRQAFQEFLEQNADFSEPVPDKGAQSPSSTGESKDASIVGKLSSWFGKRK